jgi:hypothetical protein
MEAEFLNRHEFGKLYKLLLFAVFISGLALLLLNLLIFVFVVKEYDAMTEGNKTLKHIADVLNLLAGNK